MIRTHHLLIGLLIVGCLLTVAVPASASHSDHLVEHTIHSPSEVEIGEEATISGQVTNREDARVFIEVTVDGTTVLSEAVDPGETVEFTRRLRFDQAGEPNVDVEIYVAGQHHTTETATIDVNESQDDGGLLDINLGEKIKQAVYAPFNAFADAVVGLLTHLFTSYPDVHPNPDVQELHRLSLIVAFALSTLTVVLAGILFQVGPIFGVSYRQVRMLLPRVLIALVFGTVSPFLLQYAVDLADALTIAFRPSNPGFLGSVQLTGGLIVVGLLDAFLLAAVAAIFVVRDVYILFAAAASPLIALGWALPYTRRFAHSFIGVFWAFLLIGPLDMIVFRLVLSLLQPSGVEVPHWLLAMGGFAMLLGVPYMVLSTGQSMAGVLAGMAVGEGSGWLSNTGDGGTHAAQSQQLRQRRQERELIKRYAESDSRRRRRTSPSEHYSSGGINRRTEPSESRDLESNPFWNKEGDDL